jgi:hypothetical protein
MQYLHTAKSDNKGREEGGGPTDGIPQACCWITLSYRMRSGATTEQRGVGNAEEEVGNCARLQRDHVEGTENKTA